MIKVNIKLINNYDDRILASGYYKEFKDIDELIRYCASCTNYKYTCTYDLVEEV